MELSNFVTQLSKDYPDLRFVYGKRFSFRPPKTIVIGPSEDDKTIFLLFHELGHALSKKYRYATAVDRLKIESLAWQTGKKVYEAYQTSNQFPSLPPWDDDFAEENLDTYRDWLHQKSKCKTCGLTTFQTLDGSWKCPYCSQFKS